MRPKLVVLVAEDDPNDALLLQRAFRKCGVDLPAHICDSGDDAMEYLKGQGRYREREKYPFPRALITDLKMPKCDGFQLLEWLKAHPECNLIPKIVLSASRDEKDVVRAYQLGTNCYFQKPTTFQDLCKVVELAHTFWSTAEVPPLPPNC